jgi:hypothetical protein
VDEVTNPWFINRGFHQWTLEILFSGQILILARQQASSSWSNFHEIPRFRAETSYGLIQIPCVSHFQQTTSRIALERAQPEVFRLHLAPLFSNSKTEGPKYFQALWRYFVACFPRFLKQTNL